MPTLFQRFFAAIWAGNCRAVFQGLDHSQGRQASLVSLGALLQDGRTSFHRVTTTEVDEFLAWLEEVLQREGECISNNATQSFRQAARPHEGPLCSVFDPHCHLEDDLSTHVKWEGWCCGSEHCLQNVVR